MMDSLTRSPEIGTSISALERRITNWLWAAGILAATGLVIIGWGVRQFGRTPNDLGNLGTFLAGTVGPVWSAAGLILIYVAFLGQRRQILLQEEAIELNRLELSQTREELRGQKEQLELQKEEMRAQSQLALRQGFETTFFELLRFHREAADRQKAIPIAGGLVNQAQAAFEGAALELEPRLRTRVGTGTALAGASDPRQLALLNEAFKSVCLSRSSDFGHYFRTLYHLLRLVDESEVTDKQRYVSLVRAQMSNAELLLLMVNGLAEVGREKLKPLIERYAFLEPLRLADGYGNYARAYDRSAYGDRVRELYLQLPA